MEEFITAFRNFFGFYGEPTEDEVAEIMAELDDEDNIIDDDEYHEWLDNN
jgi:hypothetical protein